MKESRERLIEAVRNLKKAKKKRDKTIAELRKNLAIVFAINPDETIRKFAWREGIQGSKFDWATKDLTAISKEELDALKKDSGMNIEKFTEKVYKETQESLRKYRAAHKDLEDAYRDRLEVIQDGITSRSLSSSEVQKITGLSVSRVGAMTYRTLTPKQEPLPDSRTREGVNALMADSGATLTTGDKTPEDLVEDCQVVNEKFHRLQGQMYLKTEKFRELVLQMRASNVEIKQSEIARDVGVHRSVVTRWIQPIDREIKKNPGILNSVKKEDSLVIAEKLIQSGKERHESFLKYQEAIAERKQVLAASYAYALNRHWDMAGELIRAAGGELQHQFRAAKLLPALGYQKVDGLWEAPEE